MPRLVILIVPRTWENLKQAAEWCQQSIYDFVQRAIEVRLDEIKMAMQEEDERLVCRSLQNRKTDSGSP